MVIHIAVSTAARAQSEDTERQAVMMGLSLVVGACLRRNLLAADANPTPCTLVAVYAAYATAPWIRALSTASIALITLAKCTINGNQLRSFFHMFTRRLSISK